MKRSEIVRQRILLLLSAVVLAIFFGMAAAPAISERQYQMTAGLTGAILDGETIPQALKNSRLSNYIQTGMELLHQYGYRSENDYWTNAVSLSLKGGVVFLCFIALILVMQHQNHKQLIDRIDKLTQYLEEINLGKEPLLTRQEDVFSHLEDEIYKTVTELRLARNSACKERQVMADNLADISHQLKTPLTSMSLMSQLLGEQVQEGQRPYVERLNHQILRLENLVSSLLTLSRLDAETLPIVPQKVGVYTLLVQAAEPVEEMARQKGIELVIQSQPDEDTFADPAWTAEAILNLIKNCIEHTPSGGTIRIAYEHNPLYIKITVCDTGPGFVSQEIPHLFQRFYRGKGAAKDSIGIGLALSRSILEKQGGTIRADNPVEGGARFTIKLYHSLQEWAK